MSTAEQSTTVAEQLEEIAPMVIERMNGSFEDSLVFVARVLGGIDDATSARVATIDIAGFALEVDDRAGTHAVRLEFDTELDDVWKITDAAYAVVRRARVASGEPGRTSAEREYEAFAAIRTWFTEVRAVEDVHPHLRRITFGGGDLTEFAPLGPDTFLYVLLPPPGRTDLTIDRSFTWEGVPSMPEEDRPAGAYYTLRAWRPESSELDMLFVLHDDPGAASAWAARAKPGDQVALWGPREAYEPPPDTEWYLLVADETGLPAVATILESLPDEVPVHVFAEVGSADEHLELQGGPRRTITWLHRDGGAPGTSPELLGDAVRGLGLLPGRAYAWGGGESRTMTRIRRYLRDDVGWSREQVNLVAYWRHSQSPPDDED
jgi:NADPH-dependent ferric siderophore reductase